MNRYEVMAQERKEALKDFFGGQEGEEVPDEQLQRLFQFEELMIQYRSAIREITTKLEVLNDEFSVEYKRNPISFIKTRIKKPESIYKKLKKLGYEFTAERISRIS